MSLESAPRVSYIGILVFAVVLSHVVALSAHEQFRIIGKIVRFEKPQLVVDSNYSERFVRDHDELRVGGDASLTAVLGACRQA